MQPAAVPRPCACFLADLVSFLVLLGGSKVEMEAVGMDLEERKEEMEKGDEKEKEKENEGGWWRGVELS